MISQTIILKERYLADKTKAERKQNTIQREQICPSYMNSNKIIAVIVPPLLCQISGLVHDRQVQYVFLIWGVLPHSPHCSHVKMIHPARWTGAGISQALTW